MPWHGAGSAGYVVCSAEPSSLSPTVVEGEVFREHSGSSGRLRREHIVKRAFHPPCIERSYDGAAVIQTWGLVETDDVAHLGRGPLQILGKFFLPQSGSVQKQSSAVHFSNHSKEKVTATLSAPLNQYSTCILKHPFPTSPFRK